MKPSNSDSETLAAVMVVIDGVKQYPDPEPEACARRVVAHLLNRALVAEKRARS